MAHVTVTINGKAYRMACDEGEEENLVSLSERFDGYVSRLKGAFGEIGDQRLTVMAAITVLDELQEMENRIRGLDADFAALESSRDEALGQASSSDQKLAQQLQTAAHRIENLARQLSLPRGEKS